MCVIPYFKSIHLVGKYYVQCTLLSTQEVALKVPCSAFLVPALLSAVYFSPILCGLLLLSCQPLSLHLASGFTHHLKRNSLVEPSEYLIVIFSFPKLVVLGQWRFDIIGLDIILLCAS